MLHLFGTYNDDKYTHPCSRANESNDDDYNTDKRGYRIIKQPFQCTDVSVADTNGKVFPTFQTLRCVGLKEKYEMFYDTGAGVDDSDSEDGD